MFPLHPFEVKPSGQFSSLQLFLFDALISGALHKEYLKLDHYTIKPQNPKMVVKLNQQDLMLA